MRAPWDATGGLRITDTVIVPPADLRWRFSRATGPGGQGINTTDSRVELSLDLARSSALTGTDRARLLETLSHRLVDGVLTVTASEHRSQLRNREAASARMATLLRAALAPPGPQRRPTRPTRGSVRRRLDSKTRRGQTKRLRRNPPP